jgi:hypothetical protein
MGIVMVSNLTEPGPDVKVIAMTGASGDTNVPMWPGSTVSDQSLRRGLT